MKATVRFMKAPSRVGKVTGDDWETLQYLEGVEDPIVPPKGGTYRAGLLQFRVDEVEYGYKFDQSQYEDGEWICVITVEVSQI